MVNMKNKMFIICLMFLLLVGCNKMNEEVPIMSNSNTKIVKSDNLSFEYASKVKLYDVEFDEEVVYSIVGSTEASPKAGKISDESPVGSALLGKSVGETVVVETPGGSSEYKVLEISK